MPPQSLCQSECFYSSSVRVKYFLGVTKIGRNGYAVFSRVLLSRERQYCIKMKIVAAPSRRIKAFTKSGFTGNDFLLYKNAV